MRRHLQYLKYVLRHKWFVFKAGREIGVPLLILIVHDWDKFLPDEWFAYARTFYKPNGEKQYVESVDFAAAWMKHQHRNKHHWQYWLTRLGGRPIRETNVLVWDRGEAQAVVEREKDGGTILELVDCAFGLFPQPMPDVYRREMLADWRGAGAALGFPDTKDWYLKNRDTMILHDETRRWIESALGIIESEASE